MQWAIQGAILFIQHPDLQPFPEHVSNTSKLENADIFTEINHGMSETLVPT